MKNTNGSFFSKGDLKLNVVTWSSLMYYFEISTQGCVL